LCFLQSEFEDLAVLLLLGYWFQSITTPPKSKIMFLIL
jgi:hypothetical protein